MSRLALGSVVGTTLEYFDFAIYNTLVALVFGQLFFPVVDPDIATILAFSTFAVGYLSRPVGGLIFGHLGDRYGRRFVLVATLLSMGITTLLMGALPTYATAGIASPILLVLLRFIQGAALGGEWAGAVLLSVEHGSEQHRGRNGAWAQMGPSIGILLATGSIALLNVALTPEQFLNWGWRLPFFASALLIAFGVWIRYGVSETPPFAALNAQGATVRAPVSEVFRNHWRTLLRVGSARIGPDVFYSLVTVFTLSYVTLQLAMSRTIALIALSIGGALNALFILLFGDLSDRVGRIAVYGGGVALSAVGAFLLFPLLETRTTTGIIAAVGGGLIVHAAMYGPQAAFIAEQFPTQVRYAGASLAYTLAGIFGGGIAPVMFAAFLHTRHGRSAIVVYALIALGITALALTITHRSSSARGGS